MCFSVRHGAYSSSSVAFSIDYPNYVFFIPDIPRDSFGRPIDVRRTMFLVRPWVLTISVIVGIWRPRICRNSIIPDSLTVPAGRQKILAKLLLYHSYWSAGTSKRKLFLRVFITIPKWSSFGRGWDHNNNRRAEHDYFTWWTARGSREAAANYQTWASLWEEIARWALSWKRQVSWLSQVENGPRVQDCEHQPSNRRTLRQCWTPIHAKP